ncbi:thioesterase family protein [Brevundimonas sp.]|uniref:thioesterase family protein n=1 Tax=Brevundimonas sp. TaxID=1871086 RepID=UPI002D64D38E|nr:thioesterase family protein [Brevundimonas sp.]HYD27244.1 thioesterase family protein [Brevundimonas sp.]
MNGPAFVACDQPNRFIATPAAGGPWTATHCHGGAPAGLLAHIAEAHGADTPMSTARFTADFLRPTPIGPELEVRTKVVRNGRQTRAIELELITNDQTLVRASALMVRQLEGRETPGGIDRQPPSDGRHRAMPGGFSEQFSIVPCIGGFGHLGPAQVWFRMESPLIDQQLPNAVARAVASADFASGIAADLSFRDWTYPSLDLSIGFLRPPEAGWILLQSHWLPHAGGRTVCVTVLGDCIGPFAHATQTVMINARSGQTQAPPSLGV